MKKVYLALAASVVTGALLVGGLAGTAFAWHPKGQIKKLVQNVTTNSALADADDDASAVEAKPGDVLRYVIEVENTAGPANNEWNDLWYTKITDELPAGVELVSDPGERKYTADLDVILPGETKKVEFTVKVTKQENGAIKNTACFTGDSKVRDVLNNRPEDVSGCDDANVKVTVPEEEEEKPEPQVLGEADILPVTGAGSIAGLFAGVSGLGYAAHRIVNRKR